MVNGRLKIDTKFWKYLELLVQNNKVIIDRPKGSHLPKYHKIMYPLDYGYLESTHGGDGNDIDIWQGTKKEKILDAIVCTVDILKKDSEIKLLLGCTDYEKKIITNFHHNDYMAAILVTRIF